jgi:glycerol-3-phosphate dehydrogenase (NAD(P)+)
MKIAVIGAGSWGTATACLLGKQQNDISLWALEPEVAEGINSTRKNPMYVSDLYVPPAVRATNDMEEALHGAEIVVLVVVSHVMREVIEKAKPFIGGSAIVISQTKGIENGTYMRMSQVVEDVMGPEVHDRLAVLSGPNHAEEVGREIPSATVIAAHDSGVAKMLQETYMS